MTQVDVKKLMEVHEIISDTSLINPVPAFAKSQADMVVEEVFFEKALGHELRKQGMIQIPPPHLGSMSPKV